LESRRVVCGAEDARVGKEKFDGKRTRIARLLVVVVKAEGGGLYTT
jgi:hypothetical protein